jgi:hypothetical protein
MTSVETELDNVGAGHTRPNRARRQTLDFCVALVAHGDLAICIEHAQALVHVLNRIAIQRKLFAQRAILLL